MGEAAAIAGEEAKSADANGLAQPVSAAQSMPSGEAVSSCKRRWVGHSHSSLRFSSERRPNKSCTLWCDRWNCTKFVGLTPVRTGRTVRP